MDTRKSQERSEASLAFEAYWRSRIGTGALPAFDDFDPLDIPHLVPNFLTCEIQFAPVRNMNIRFSGSVTQERTGFNLSGFDPGSFFDDAALESVWASVDALIKTPCGLVQHNDVFYENAQDAVTQMLFLPTVTASPDRFFLVCLLEWVGYHNEGENEHPIRILPSTDYRWLDLGHGVPDL